MDIKEIIKRIKDYSVIFLSYDNEIGHAMSFMQSYKLSDNPYYNLSGPCGRGGEGGGGTQSTKNNKILKSVLVRQSKDHFA